MSLYWFLGYPIYSPLCCSQAYGRIQATHKGFYMPFNGVGSLIFVLFKKKKEKGRQDPGFPK